MPLSNKKELLLLLRLRQVEKYLEKKQGKKEDKKLSKEISKSVSDKFYGNNTNLQIDGMCRKQETYLIMRSQK